MTFADELKSARLAAGLTVEQTAELLGVTRMTVYNWERGDRSPPVQPVLTQAQILEAISAAEHIKKNQARRQKCQ